MTKKIPATQPVNFTKTLVVCAPNRFSVTAPPKAAPSPSLFGRCIKMTNIIRSATRTHRPNKTVIKIDIGTGNMAEDERYANAQHSTFQHSTFQHSTFELQTTDSAIGCWALSVERWAFTCFCFSLSPRSHPTRRGPIRPISGRVPSLHLRLG